MNQKIELKNDINQDINNLKSLLIKEIINLKQNITNKELELYELMLSNENN